MSYAEVQTTFYEVLPKTLGKGHRSLNREVMSCKSEILHVSTQNLSWIKVSIKAFRPINPTLSLIPVLLCQHLQLLCLLLLSCTHRATPLWTFLQVCFCSHAPSPRPTQPNYLAPSTKSPSVVKKPPHTPTSSLSVLSPSSVLPAASASLPWMPAWRGDAHPHPPGGWKRESLFS